MAHFITYIRKLRRKDPEAVYYFYTFIFNCALSVMYATYVLFLLNQHLNLFQVSMVNLSFMIGSFLFEIPTGAFADHFGRKKSIILSGVCISVAFATYYVSSTLFMFILAEIIAALAMTFANGALDAWLVDTLGATEQQRNVDIIFSHGTIIVQLAGLISALCGAYLGSISLRLPMAISALLSLVAVAVAIVLIDEKQYPKRASKSITHQIQQVGQIAREGVMYSVRHKVILWIVLSSFLSQLGFQALNMFWSPRFNALVGNHIWMMGWLFAGMSIFMILGGFIVKKLIKNNRNYFEISIITSLYLIIPIFIAAITNTLGFVLIGFLTYEIGRGMFYPIHKSYLNQYTISEHRATVFSFDSMIGKVGAGIGLLLLGWIANITSIQISWFISGVILLFLIPIFIRAYYHERRL